MDYKDFFHLFENKDRFIDKLDLTDEQKEELKAFFKKHPTYEGKVDWNKKDLKWEDFEELLKTEGQTKNQIKKYGKSGKAQIEDLVEGKDYEVLVDKPNLTVYYPMNFKASEVLAKPTTPPEGVTGRWCIAGKNYSPGTQDQHWKRYTQERHIDFFFVFMEHRKYAIARYPEDKYNPGNSGKIEIFNQDDQQTNDIWDSNDFYSKVHLNLEWLKKLIAEQPNKVNPVIKPEIEGKGYRLSEDGRTLLSVDGHLERLEIPAGVTVVGDGAAFNHQNLKQVIIPASVTQLGVHAFAECTGMEKISISLAPGAKLQGVGYNAKPFQNTTGLLEILVQGAETPSAEESELGWELFGKAAFHTVKIRCLNDNAKYTISDGCFSNCRRLENLEIGTGCTSIMTEAFFQCSSLKSVYIPPTVKWIGMEAFAHCTNVRSFTIAPRGALTDIDSNCFYDNPYVSEIAIPDNCNYVGMEAFHELPNLRNLIIPAGLKYLGTPPFVLYNNGSRGDGEDYEPYDWLFDRDNPDILPKNLQITFRGTREQWNKLTEYFTSNEKEFLNRHLLCLYLDR